jgi:RNA polymerase sigma-70 factor (ECF subfamily)
VNGVRASAGLVETDTIVQVLLRERLRIAAAASAVVRDVHAADDVFQQVVLAALEHKSEFRDPDHVLAWALRAARCRAVDLARRRKLAYLPDDVLDLLESGSAQPNSTDVVEALHDCLEGLAAPARALLQMKYDDGLTAAAIAARMRRSADAVYQNLSRVHRVLRACVEQKLAYAAAANEGGRS